MKRACESTMSPSVARAEPLNGARVADWSEPGSPKPEGRKPETRLKPEA
jgi:hypothetical protein